MTEEASLGVARLRQAIANQATCGSGKFELSIDSADRLCSEIEDELARLAWAEDVPVPRDADGMAVPLDTTDLIDQPDEMRGHPTCEMKGRPGERYGVCSRCGAFVREDAVTNCTEAIPVKFCPNCRAKVI